MRLAAALALASVLAACGSSGTDDPAPDPRDPGPTSPGETGTGGSTGAGPGLENLDASSSYVDIANLASSTVAMDICVSARGKNTWVGPLLAKGSTEAPGEVNKDGVRFDKDGALSSFVKVAPGAYDFRVVVAGSDCSASLVDVADAPDLKPAGGATVLVSGKSGALRARAYPAEFYGRTAVRFIHAASGIGNVDFRIGSDVIAKNLHANVAPAQAGTAIGSPAGYAGVGSSETPPFSVSKAGMPSVALAFARRLSDGANDVILVGNAGSTDSPLRALVCDSNLSKRDGGMQSCDIVGVDLSASPTGNVRLGNFANPEGEFRLCVKYPGQAAFDMLVDGGVRSLNLTRYYPIPSGKSDLKIIDGAAKDCSVAGVASGTIDLAGGAFTTQLVFGAAPALSLKSLPDVIDLGLTRAHLRLVHAAPATAPLIGGVGKAGAFVKMFDPLAYGEASPTQPFDGTANGFVTTRSAAAPTVDASIRDALWIEKGETWTAFAVIGTKFNSTETELQIMVCNDAGLPYSPRTGCRDPRSAL